MEELDGRSLAMLAATCKTLNKLIKDDLLWKSSCLRELNSQHPGEVAFSWNRLYASAFSWNRLYASTFDGSHYFMFRHDNGPVDWRRVGAFYFETPRGLVIDASNTPRAHRVQQYIEIMLQKGGAFEINNIKPGIWIADMYVARCPNCQLRFQRCRHGRIITLDVRHMELFLCEGFREGTWNYTLLGSYTRRITMVDAIVAVFDLRHMNDPASIDIFNSMSWNRRPSMLTPLLTPIGRTTNNAAAIHTYASASRGYRTDVFTMTAGPEGEVVSIRMSQQFQPVV